MPEEKYRVYQIKTDVDKTLTLDRELVYGYIELCLQLDNFNGVSVKNVWVELAEYESVLSFDKERRNVINVLTPINK
jgi:hypothetical protein